MYILLISEAYKNISEYMHLIILIISEDAHY